MRERYSEGLWKGKVLQSRLPWGKRPIRPAEVSEGLCQLMLRKEHILEDVNYNKVVPNRYIVELSVENYERNFLPIEKSVVQQWREKLLEHLNTTNSRQGRKEYRFAGPLHIEIKTSPDLLAHQVRILCWVQAESNTVLDPMVNVRSCLEMFPGDQRWPLRPGITCLGREEICEIHLDMEEVQQKRLVSGQHAYIRMEGGKIQLYDGSPAGKPSLNGTYVNNQRVPPGGHILKDRDVIILAALDPDHPRLDTPGVVALRFLQSCS
jgi:hypothetical protein